MKTLKDIAKLPYATIGYNGSYAVIYYKWVVNKQLAQAWGTNDKSIIIGAIDKTKNADCNEIYKALEKFHTTATNTRDKIAEITTTAPQTVIKNISKPTMKYADEYGGYLVKFTVTDDTGTRTTYKVLFNVANAEIPRIPCPSGPNSVAFAYRNQTEKIISDNTPDHIKYDIDELRKLPIRSNKPLPDFNNTKFGTYVEHSLKGHIIVDFNSPVNPDDNPVIIFEDRTREGYLYAYFEDEVYVQWQPNIPTSKNGFLRSEFELLDDDDVIVNMIKKRANKIHK